ncbi:hypothetical protein PG994_012643 [Apiospora phragmitis]|uniref:Cytochrome P450 n=1 Tax=Apiospora phragmitis TaxID=2905665 RepID=A0ABR1TCX4_9PEZI
MDNLIAYSWAAAGSPYWVISFFFVAAAMFSYKSIYACFAAKFQRLRYLVAGPQIIDQAYAASPGRAFKVATPSNNHLLVTSSELIKEVLDAPTHLLSLHAVAKELLQPKYTMYGFEWQEQRGVEGTGFVRALRSKLTSHLPKFHPELDRMIKSCLLEELSTPDDDGKYHIFPDLFPMIKRIITKVNCLVFFGEELSENTEFTTAALEFPQTVVLTAELLRVTPGFMRPLVAWIVTRRHGSAKVLFRYLEPEVSRRRSEMAQQDELGIRPKPMAVDCMQWLIDTSPRKNPWSTPRLIGEILAIWFSSVHQLAMTTTYVIEDLCQHSEYIEPLKSEMQEAAKHGMSLEVVEGYLPLLDSFVKESIRFSNADACKSTPGTPASLTSTKLRFVPTVSCRRKALCDVVLKDGSRIEKNDWVCIPQRAMMCDALRYSNAHAFDGYRFARANAALRQGKTTADVPDKSPSTVTSPSIDWPIWGLGTAIW